MPTTRYTPSGEASIAYQVIGEGALDVLFMTGWISQVEQLWELPALRRMLERLAVFSRLILFDRRGTGLSDSVGESHTLEQEVRDALAVLDAVGSERAALFTYGLGGPVGALLAADRPERVGALIMYASIARTSWAADYDWAMTVEDRAQWTEHTVAAWSSTVQGSRCWRLLWLTIRRLPHGLRVFSAWRRARARPASS
jgi:pimeloyl-ACP methyl ester carboxylesterase